MMSYFPFFLLTPPAATVPHEPPEPEKVSCDLCGAMIGPAQGERHRATHLQWIEDTRPYAEDIANYRMTVDDRRLVLCLVRTPFSTYDKRTPWFYHHALNAVRARFCRDVRFNYMPYQMDRGGVRAMLVIVEIA